MSRHEPESHAELAAARICWPVGSRARGRRRHRHATSCSIPTSVDEVVALEPEPRLNADRPPAPQRPPGPRHGDWQHCRGTRSRWSVRRGGVLAGAVLGCRPGRRAAAIVFTAEARRRASVPGAHRQRRRAGPAAATGRMRRSGRGCPATATPTATPSAAIADAGFSRSVRGTNGMFPPWVPMPASEIALGARVAASLSRPARRAGPAAPAARGQRCPARSTVALSDNGVLSGVDLDTGMPCANAADGNPAAG